MGTGHIDLLQRPHEPRQIVRHPLQIGDGAIGIGAGQPLVHRPVKGVALARAARRQRHRHRQRQVRGQLRQPPHLLGGLTGRPSDARQPDRRVLTQAVDVVIGPVRIDRDDRRAGPVRELAGQQAAHQRHVGVDLVGV
jgi:hypothetical protein